MLSRQPSTGPVVLPKRDSASCSPEEESDEETLFLRIPSNASFTDAIVGMWKNPPMITPNGWSRIYSTGRCKSAALPTEKATIAFRTSLLLVALENLEWEGVEGIRVSDGSTN